MSLKETSLAPGFLLAMPQLEDPNFSRAVVLMVEHDENGSFGLVVNQPSDLRIEELLGALEIKWQGDPAETVWSGGPVMPSSGWVLHGKTPSVPAPSASLEDALASDGSIAITEELFLSNSPAHLALLAEAPPARLRFLLGYSGWGPGQLASELERGSWLHAELNLEILFESPAEELWQRALRSLGIDPEAIIQSRGIH
jgi:putative transcriptional regulator